MYWEVAFLLSYPPAESNSDELLFSCMYSCWKYLACIAPLVANALQ